MRTVTLWLVIGAVMLSGQEKPTLYERVGRYDAIAAIVEEYFKGVRADPQLARFGGRGRDSLARAKQLLKDQLCALTGGPCTYIGRDMKTAHGGLGITESDWAANTKHMTAALEKAHVSSGDETEFLAIVESLKPAIVEKEKR
jgi:hemoglobin